MHFKVIVVGAGLAGLSAVGKLRDLGIASTLILEARSDIGGRVRMTDFAGSKFNIGPEWLHGQKSNPIYQLATSKLNLKTLDCDDYTYFFNKPESLTIHERENVFKRSIQRLQKTVDTKLMSLSLDTLPGRSVSDVLNLTQCSEDIDVDRIAKYWSFNYENGSSASDYSALVYRLSSKIFENVPAFSDYYFADRNGFVKIVDSFSKRSDLNNENVSFNDPVTRIINIDEQIEVVTKQNKVYTCDYCILTAPISVINKQGISIYPRPEKEVRETFKKITFSTYTRVFVELSRDMFIPDYDWFVDLSTDCNKDICLWQNPRNSPPVLIAHVCQLSEHHKSNLTKNVTQSLQNIFQEGLKSILNVKVVSLDDSQYSFGAFPCATVDFNNDDVLALTKLGECSRLQYAGDSYSLDYFGTVQGAVSSGCKAAERIHGYFDK